MIEHVWSTAILKSHIDDPALLNDLLQRIFLDPDAATNEAAVLTRSTIDQAVADGDPLFTTVHQLIVDHVDQYMKQAFDIENVPYRVEMFYMVQPQGAHVNYHNHKGSTLTGILYINAVSGDVVLMDPRGNANRGVISEVYRSGHFDPVQIKPTTGDLVILPSYVYHMGTPNLSSMPRVVLVFDVVSK